jgi:hypothetical protein
MPIESAGPGGGCFRLDAGELGLEGEDLEDNGESRLLWDGSMIQLDFVINYNPLPVDRRKVALSKGKKGLYKHISE